MASLRNYILTMPSLRSLFNTDIRTHLYVACVIRLLLILYGVYHDRTSSVSYTDIDYKVFTDAARHVTNNNSPYDRYTYRYSPLIAFLLTPNIFIHPLFGKFLFSIIDIGVGLLIRLIVMNNLVELKNHTNKSSFTSFFIDNEVLSDVKNNANVRNRKRSKNFTTKKVRNQKLDGMNTVMCSVADKSMLMWLYNPLTMTISTRGNCDCLAVFIVLCTLYFIQVRKSPFMAGIIHGLSIHFRIYPIVYSLTLFMFLSEYSHYSLKKRAKAIINKSYQINAKETNTSSVVSVQSSEKKTIFKIEYLMYLVPNWDQLKLILGCIFSLTSSTCLFYWIYGYQFLYETYIYHFSRVDFRHNFSLYFYLQYITAWVRNIGLWQKVLMTLPQLVLLLVFSVRYGLNRFSLNFAILLETVVFVIYNRVLTSQYFVWILAILPLCVWQIRITAKKAIFILFIWVVAQLAWLLPAYLLEYQGDNTFFYIWIQSVSFFCANVAILGRLIMHFMNVDKK